MNARELVGGWDVALIHDPQPAALHTLVPEKARAAGCGAATSTCPSPNPETMGKLLPYISTYPQSLFHVRRLRARRHGWQTSTSCRRPIDPLAPKNMALSPEGRRVRVASSSASTSTGR